MSDYSIGVPFEALVVMIIVIPVCVSLFFGLLAFRHVTPQAFWCRRCLKNFTRKAQRGFPTVCPLCRARDWNAE